MTLNEGIYAKCIINSVFLAASCHGAQRGGFINVFLALEGGMGCRSRRVGSGFRIHDSRCRILDSGFKIQDARFKILDSKLDA